MKKKTFLILWAVLAAMSAGAGERTLRDWLKDLDARLRRTEGRRQGQLVAAASVRGAKQEESSKLYWKGRKGNQAVTAEQLDAFKAAVARAQDGKTAEARASLTDFLAKYPSSPLADDAKKTLALLPADAMPAETAKP